MKREFEIIRKIVEEEDYRLKDSLVYSLFLALSDRALFQFFFEALDDTIIKNHVLKHILRRAEARSLAGLDNFIKRALVAFKREAGRRRTSLGVCLTAFVSYMSPRDIEKLFFSQINSSKISNRKRAYSIAIHIWNQKIENCLWEAWDTYNDIDVIDVLSVKGSTEALTDRFDELWDFDGIPLSFKNRILSAVAQHSFQTVAKLKHSHPISYLSACVHARKIPSQSEALALVDQAKSLGELGYGIWCLGKLGMLPALLNVRTKLPRLEKALQKSYRDYGFLGESA
jgi:hypothetical protein